MKKILDYLQELGLTEIEASIYEGLLDYGASTVQELAKKLNANRITVHTNIEKLKEQGLVTESRVGARRTLLAEPADRLNYLIERKEENVKSLKEKFPDILNTINSTLSNPLQSEGLGIKYYEGRESVKLIYKEALLATEFRAFVNTEILRKTFPENVSMFTKSLKDNPNRNIWEIMEKSELSVAYAKNNIGKQFHCKFIPENMNLSVIDYMIFDGKVAIVNLEDETSGAILANHNYYDNAKAIFELVWQMLPEPELS